jgi:squalene synthase HpnC
MRNASTSRDAPAYVLRQIAAGALAQNRSENFPVALRFLPRHAREQLLHVYVFARFVDDIGDRAAGDRTALLDLVAADIQRLPEGGAQLEPVAQLAALTVTCGIEALLDLVAANRADQTVTRYATFDELLGYCAKSAAPVGRMVLAIAGVADEPAVRRSDAVCAALQVLEHCQDVREDALAGRVYLPAEDLRAAGVVDADLVAGRTSPALRRVVAQQVDRAAGLLADGPPLVAALHGWARVAVSGYVAGGLCTVAALRSADYDVLARTIRPGKAPTLATAARLALRRPR